MKIIVNVIFFLIDILKMSFKIKLSAELEPETQETYNVVKCF